MRRRNLSSMRRDYRSRRSPMRSRERDYRSRDYAMRNENDRYVTEPISKFSELPRQEDMRERDYYDDSRRDYRNYRDYRDYRDYGSYDDEEMYYEDLERLEKKLKRKSRFDTTQKEVIEKAEQMNVKFEEYDEEEFYVVFLMLTTDFPKVSNSIETYIEMAKQWLEDDDIAVSPSEKLCSYISYIIKGEE